jgi:Cyclin
LTAALLTSKFYNDVFYGNHFAAYIGGVPLEEMNLLELEFLKIVDWSLWVDPSEYEFYLQGIIQHYSFVE